MKDHPITLSECARYVEDPYITYDTGETKGQCANCGAKWFEHNLESLPENEKESAKTIQQDRGIEP